METQCHDMSYSWKRDTTLTFQ